MGIVFEYTPVIIDGSNILGEWWELDMNLW